MRDLNPLAPFKKGGTFFTGGAFALNCGIRPQLSIFSSPFVKGDRGIFHCCILNIIRNKFMTTAIIDLINALKGNFVKKGDVIVDEDRIEKTESMR
jgi:hypothetical protein